MWLESIYVQKYTFASKPIARDPFNRMETIFRVSGPQGLPHQHEDANLAQEPLNEFSVSAEIGSLGKILVGKTCVLEEPPK